MQTARYAEGNVVGTGRQPWEPGTRLKSDTLEGEEVAYAYP